MTRHLENGIKPFAAALLGAQEIGFTVFSISISLIAVFIPLLLMGGIVGRLFREFAVMLSTAIVVSMIVSLTTTPMMCAYLLRNEPKGGHGRLYLASEKFFDGMLSIYRRSLRRVLDNPTPTLVVLLLTIALNVVLVIKIPKGFFPPAGHGSNFRWSPGAAGFLFHRHEQLHSTDRQRDQERSAVANVIASTGGGGATNTGSIYIALKPLGERKVQRRPDHQPAASPVEPSAGGFRVSPSLTGSAHRRALQQCAVPVHSAIGQHPGPFQVGTNPVA